MSAAYLQCLSHTPLVGHFDPDASVLDAVNRTVEEARERIARFDPQLVILFAPDHYNGFFYDVMPAFCVGMRAHAIGDFGTPKGDFDVPEQLAADCISYVMAQGVDVALSWTMQVDHAFSQPMDFLLGDLRARPVIPIFINGVAPPMPSFQRARLLGEAVGRFAKGLNQRVLFLGSGGLSHQPPVPELATANAHMADRLCGSGRNLPPDEREARTQRVINAARLFVQDQNTLHPLNPEWDQGFLDTLASGRIADLDAVGNQELSRLAGKSTHEVKAWVAAFAALSAYGPYQSEGRFYQPIPHWITGYGALAAYPSA